MRRKVNTHSSRGNDVGDELPCTQELWHCQSNRRLRLWRLCPSMQSPKGLNGNMNRSGTDFVVWHFVMAPMCNCSPKPASRWRVTFQKSWTVFVPSKPDGLSSMENWSSPTETNFHSTIYSCVCIPLRAEC